MGLVTGQAPDAAGVGELSDAELIERSRREPDCFAVIFDRHADEILRYAHARLGPDRAEDIAAETFLAAFRRRDHYDPAWADARPWLYGIAVRLIGKDRRSESRYRRMLQTAPAERLAADFGDRSADRVTAQQLRPQLAAALNGLPARDRELLLLIAWAGLSYEESARALGISTSAVRSRLNRIRVRTRKELGGANPARLDEEYDRG
ncbi:MAG: RNA polymerase sigma factor [Actinobacteria bacterium]|nr:RNA polymerase sigma factor [Actinomycetota bacterium]